ncbi:MAG: S8 family serine peptidase [Pseudomonadota bacterium]
MKRLINRIAASTQDLAVVGLLASVAVSATGAALAQEAREAPTVFMSSPSGRFVAVGADALMARAQEANEVRVIVELNTSFASGAERNAAAAFNQRARIEDAQESMMGELENPSNVKGFKTVPYMAMTVSPTDLSRMMNMPGVRSIHEDVAVPPSLADSVGLTEGNRLWWKGQTGEGAVVAILDTGTRPDHFAFRDPAGPKIVGSACFSSFTAFSLSVCPNGQTSQVSDLDGSAAPNCSDSITGCDHGTHVAAIAAGFQRGNHGMARGADILSVQVFSSFTNRADCGSSVPCARTWTSDQIAGLEQVLIWKQSGMNVAAANMSLGGGLQEGYCDDDPRKAIIDNLRAAGVATVTASGNSYSDDSVLAPGCISSAVTVGSTTKEDALSDFSNHAQMVDLLAPGSDILAANASGDSRATHVFNGTSMATPHVAGAFALFKAARPDATVDQIERALKCTGIQVTRNDMPKPRISVLDAYKRFINPQTRMIINFNQPKGVDRWNDILGNWTHESDRMRVITDGNQVWHLTQAPFCANDIQVTAQMQRTYTDDSTQYGGIILSSAASDDGTFSGLAFLYSVSPSGENKAAVVEIENLNGFIHPVLNPTDFLCNQVFSGKERGQLRKLVAEKRGNTLVFIIDGQTVCSVETDARFTDGQAGILMAAPANSPGHQLEVLRVRLQALEQ